MKRLIGLVLVLGGAVFLIGVYLAPNSLRHCADVPTQATAGCQPADAIVTISGGDTAARVRQAVTLYQKGWAPLLVVSGAAADKTGPSNAQAMQQLAVRSGVPRQAIVQEDLANNTKENAQHSLAALQRRGVKRVILVTSPYHQRRASLEFNRAASGMTILDYPAYPDRDWPRLWWLHPTSWWLALGELGRIIGVYIGVSS